LGGEDELRNSAIYLQYFNVGGGITSVYPLLIPPDLINYFNAIEQEVNKNDIGWPRYF
jgi:diaminopimelate decarboxylase